MSSLVVGVDGVVVALTRPPLLPFRCCWAGGAAVVELVDGIAAFVVATLAVVLGTFTPLGPSLMSFKEGGVFDTSTTLTVTAFGFFAADDAPVVAAVVVTARCVVFSTASLSKKLASNGAGLWLAGNGCVVVVDFALAFGVDRMVVND